MIYLSYKNSNYILVKNIYLIILLLLNILILFLLFYSVNKGFDFTDEGGFLLSLKNVNTYRGGIYNYHIIISKLLSNFNLNIIQYRLISICLLLFSLSIFSFGFFKWLKIKYNYINRLENFLTIFLFLLIGNFLFFSNGVLTINNNTITQIIMQINLGLIFYLFSFSNKFFINSKKIILTLFFIGFFCSISFFNKFSTGILEIIFFIFLLYYKLNKDKLKNIDISLTILYVLFGYIIGCLLFFMVFMNIKEWLFNFTNEYNILSDHSIVLLLKNYLKNLLSFLIFFFKYFSWISLFPVLIFFNHFIKHKYFNILKFCILSFLFFLFIFEIFYFKFNISNFARGYSTTWINAYILLIFLSIEILILISFKIINKEKKRFKIEFDKIFVFTILFIYPFLSSFGTANPIFLNVYSHAITWFGIFIILSLELSFYFKNHIYVYLFNLIICVLITFQIFEGNIFSPYFSIFNSNKSNLIDQNRKIDNYKLLDGIYLDAKTIIFLNKLNTILKINKFKIGYPIIGFHVPGIIYLIKGLSPGVPYYFNKNRDSKGFDLLYNEKEKPIFMISDYNFPINEKLLEVLKKRNIIFPTDYILKGKLFFPNVNDTLKIYFPKNY